MRKHVLVTGIALVIFVAFGASAFAVPTLRISADNGVTWLTVPDGSASDTLPLVVGVVSVSTNIGNWTANVETGSTKPALGSATHPDMDLGASTNISSTLGGSLVIQFSDTDFISLPANWYFLAEIGGTTAGTITYNTYFGASNTLFDMTQLLTSQTFHPTLFGGTMGSSGFPNGVSSPYSLTQEWVIVHRGSGNTTGDSTLTAVPEPSALILFGTGLSLFGILKLRKRN